MQALDQLANAIAAMDQELVSLRAEVQARRDAQEGSVWYYMGGDEDRLDCLTVPVLIQPDKLLRLLETEKAYAVLLKKWRKIVLRLGCIARISSNHDLHDCPADDCLECWPVDVTHELSEFVAKEERIHEAASSVE